MEIIILIITVGGMTGIAIIIYDKIIVNREAATTLNETLKENIKEESSLIDYSVYKFNLKEKLMYTVLAGSLLFIIGYIFYQNIVISSFLALFGTFYKKIRKKEIIKKRKERLLLQFKQALYSLSTALVAGKSVENSFKDVIDDLKLIYPDSNTYIILEFKIINHRLENGEPIENSLLAFSERAGLDDIENFTDVFITCKRTGGDLVEVIRKTSNTISNKIETKQEIAVLIAQKKLEANILSIAPFIIIALISISSPDYMQPLYQPGIGPVIMTVSLIILSTSYLIAKKIMDIKV